MKHWQFVWLLLLIGCALARPPFESLDTVEDIVDVEDKDISEKIHQTQWEVEAEKEMSMGVLDFVRRTSRQRRAYELHEWMTKEQNEQIRNMEASNIPPLEVKNKIMEFFEQLPADIKEKWNDKYKEKCAAWINTVASEEEVQELKMLREQKDYETMYKKLAEYKKRLSDEERAKVELWKDVCQKLWHIERKEETLRRLRRELKLYSEYLQWMKDGQYQTLENMKEEGASAQQIHNKVMQYYRQLPIEEQDRITDEFRTKCISMLKDVASDEQIEELRSLYRNGEAALLSTKIDSYFAQLSPPHKETAHKMRELCKDTWTINVAPRSRREIDAEYKEWIAWMTDGQKEELEKMRNAGSSFDEIHERINGHFGELNPEKRKELATFYKQKCKSYFSALSTEEELKEIKKLYETGQQHKVFDIINAAIERLPEDRRRRAKKLQKVCHEVYHKQSHMTKTRRDVNALMDKHLSWLNEQQKDEIRKMKSDGASNTDIKAKLMDFLKHLGDDQKKTATQKSKESCYAWLREVASQEERDELEQLHHRDHTECKKKVRQYILRLSPEKQEAVNRDLDICEQIWYGNHQHGQHQQHHHHHQHGQHQQHHHHRRYIHGRHERDVQQEHTLQHALQTYLNWLTDEQKDKLRQMKEEGKSKADMQHEVMQIYENLHGESKTMATEKLKGGCKMLLKRIVGEEKVAQLKQMKDEGKSIEEIKETLQHMLSEVKDDKKKQLIDQYGPVCRKVFAMEGKSRRRRDHFTLENSLNTHLKWLSPEQKEELLKMKKDGKPKKEMEKRIMELYEHLEGDAKKEATEHLKGGCRAILSHVVGEEKYAEIKALKESGASKEELKAKVEELLQEVHDEHKKQHIEDFGPACKKIFGVAASRRRRHHFTLEESMDTHLKWLSPEQKEELLKMKKDGKPKKEIREKVMELYEHLEGDAKKEATEHLKGGCRAILAHVVGEEKYAEIKAMKESGASKEELKARLDELLKEHADDEHAKQHIEDFGPACRKLFGLSSSRKRRHH